MAVGRRRDHRDVSSMGSPARFGISPGPKRDFRVTTQLVNRRFERQTGGGGASRLLEQNRKCSPAKVWCVLRARRSLLRTAAPAKR